jgi:hypothetical protein
MIDHSDSPKLLFLETVDIYNRETVSWKCGTFWFIERLLRRIRCAAKRASLHLRENAALAIAACAKGGFVPQPVSSVHTQRMAAVAQETARSQGFGDLVPTRTLLLPLVS